MAPRSKASGDTLLAHHMRAIHFGVEFFHGQYDPDSLKEKIRDQLVFNGAQRLTSLGYMLKAAMAGPHDGIEPVRRMCKWIIDESNDPSRVTLIGKEI
jgi:hypothetical protein